MSQTSEKWTCNALKILELNCVGTEEYFILEALECKNK